MTIVCVECMQFDVPPSIIRSDGSTAATGLRGKKSRFGGRLASRGTTCPSVAGGQLLDVRMATRRPQGIHGPTEMRWCDTLTASRGLCSGRHGCHGLRAEGATLVQSRTMAILVQDWWESAFRASCVVREKPLLKTCLP